jgi:hypothetical protein
LVIPASLIEGISQSKQPHRKTLVPQRLPF